MDYIADDRRITAASLITTSVLLGLGMYINTLVKESYVKTRQQVPQNVTQNSIGGLEKHLPSQSQLSSSSA